ncbi:MAG: response regulator transcription factor [Deltaproteobacteria bacterium]|jgi:DNA-binding NarL/FixJ family response regulator|nr:response regulator transcription factor [Deltaproteobacteria bacterium]
MVASKSERGARTKNKILIVDDHPVLRRGLGALIDATADLVVCGEAATGLDALAHVENDDPDLVIIDLLLGDKDGLELVKEMKARHAEIPTLVLSMLDENVYAERALKAGARGYVTKQELDDTVLRAIRCMLAGEIYMSDRLRDRFAKKFIAGEAAEADLRVSLLSDRQLQVFRLIGQGRSTRQIADSLQLSVKTVETHRDNIKLKLSIDSSAELIRHAMRWVDDNHIGR